MSDARMDDLLDGLGDCGDCPPPCPDLERALETMEPVKMRKPRTQLAALGVISIVYAGTLLLAWKLRPDLAHLPRTWLVLYCGAWAVASGTLLWLAMVPARGAVMPRWRLAALVGGVATLGFVVAGLMFPRSVPGLSSVYPETARDLVVHSHWCLEWGLITAVAPIVVGILILRGSLPVGARRIGLALGAGGGALGALFLHLHCPITDRLHLGFVHGGVMLIAGVATALLAPRFLRP